MKKFAIILSGCGVQDGAEIHESVMAMLAVELAGAKFQLFAPNINQSRVVNHLDGSLMDETRNVLIESARIARGAIKPLADYQQQDFDAILFPGGFGVAINLSSFANDGNDMTVLQEIKRAVQTTYAAGKPIGAMCIAPVVIAKILKIGEITIGNDTETAKAINHFGARHVNADKGEVIADDKHRIYTTPCYMLESKLTDIFVGAQNLVNRMVASM
jgi:Uncharacterized protein involved in an early stage of isoprenoid biosynthesis